MDLTAVNINIIDTHENNRKLIIEWAEAGVPKLIYNGSDNRFSTLVPSELHFNMKVSDKADAKFLHLFTGNETRYVVQLEDVSDTENPVILWSGFLLAEQFTEPWTNNVFFVNFIATDGLGRIKTAKLPTTFYGNKTGISVVLAECLKTTGLNFPIFIAPAIVNAVQNIKYSQLAVNTASYYSSDKYQSPYEILEKIVLSIGCKLFTWNEKWFVIGINRFADDAIEYEEYDADGVYVQLTTLVRNKVAVVFDEYPVISIQPPFKRVIIKWQKNQPNSILPEDIYYQPAGLVDALGFWVSDGDEIYHWDAATTDFYFFMHSDVAFITPVLAAGYYIYDQTGSEPAPLPEPFYLSMSAAVTDDADANYASLKLPIFLEGAGTNNMYITLTIDFQYFDLPVEPGIATAFENGDFNDSFFYELLLDDELLVSNKSSFNHYEEFQYQLTLSGEAEISGKLEIKKIPILKNGYLDIRLFAPVGIGTTSAKRITYSNIKVTYNSADETLEKVRDIDFTTQQKLTVFHGDDNMDLTNRQYLFTDDVTYSNIVVTPTVSQQIEILSTNIEVYAIASWVYWYISEAAFNLILEHPDDVYLKYADGSLHAWNVTPGTFTTVGSGDGQFWIWNIWLTTGPYATAEPAFLVDGREVWVMAPEVSTLNTDVRYLRERWRRYEHPTEEIRFTEALARVYHDTVLNAAYKISGVPQGFLNPLELATFTFIEGKKFVITNHINGIDQNITTVDVVEATKHNVTDYVAE